MNQKQKSLHAYTDKPLSKNIREDTSETGKLVFSLEDFNLDILSYKIETYKLALIEAAADKESRDLFKVLFKGMGLRQ